MDSSSIFTLLNDRYGETIAKTAVYPRHTGVPNQCQGKGTHSVANSEKVTFYLVIDENNVVERCFFTASASAIAIASSEAICNLTEGIHLNMLHRVVTEDSINSFLDNEIPDSDYLGLLLALEAFNNALLDSITVSREPWKRYYVRTK
ncbi:MAG: iron-sulfur cluster assembly scaffold protein [Deltaproteobacteria bacterium]|nr:iron-sulfur cluster assembly scaffold protein [Deltaproteobacteria bacterium]